VEFESSLIIYMLLQIQQIVDWNWKRSNISRSYHHGIDDFFPIAGDKKYDRKMPR
jgi:hypothetical protein